jgi:ATP-dependent Lon protease
MPASRWNSTFLNELLSWISEDNTDLSELLLSPILTRVNPKDDENGETETSGEETKEIKFPDELPILPLRGVVVYPQTAVPLTIGQPRSVRLVDDVVAGDRLIGLVASRNPELENPGPEDLYSIGTIATVHRLFRAPDGTIRLLIQIGRASCRERV